ncbi:type II toxin-antitoxin system death-on-curing family toxin [Methylopila musalis]|uniref:Type II toxin-antitoxin system death-on-curing family toxin n=1 Tax=Methylopila musalis TaxID=1134781 RepID=A0ABW3Z662_9HYPH
MKRREPLWLKPAVLEILHGEQIATHGGLPGLRDRGAFDAALSRPFNKWLYGEDDLFALAAAYGFGLARNHPFSDGNKRASAIACFLFLELNGVVIPEDTDAVETTFLALAAGALSEDELAAWLKARPARGGRR